MGACKTLITEEQVDFLSKSGISNHEHQLQVAAHKRIFWQLIILYIKTLSDSRSEKYLINLPQIKN